jgi:hypothetical protein
MEQVARAIALTILRRAFYAWEFRVPAQGGRRLSRLSIKLPRRHFGREAMMHTLRSSASPRGLEWPSPMLPPPGISARQVVAWRQHRPSFSRVLREPLHRPDCGPADSVSVISAPGGPPRYIQRPARVAGASADTGQWPGWTGTESTFQPERCVVLMPCSVRSATRGHRPLPGGSDAVPERRGGIRRWSG